MRGSPKTRASEQGKVLEPYSSRMYRWQQKHGSGENTAFPNLYLI
jgi:hypothetical protein